MKPVARVARADEARVRKAKRASSSAKPGIRRWRDARPFFLFLETTRQPPGPGPARASMMEQRRSKAARGCSSLGYRLCANPSARRARRRLSIGWEVYFLTWMHLLAASASFLVYLCLCEITLQPGEMRCFFSLLRGDVLAGTLSISRAGKQRQSEKSRHPRCLRSCFL